MKVLPIILLSSLSCAAIADTTLTYKNGDDVTMKMQFSGNKMRASMLKDDSSFMIYDADKVTFTAFSTKDKSYYVMNEETIKSLGDMDALVEKMMEKQLAQMPESQRAMMRNMLKGAIKAQMPKQMPKPEYSMTGDSKSYNGINCEIVVKKVKRKKQSEFCVTHYNKIDMPSSEYNVIKSFQHIVAGLAQQYGQDRSMDFSVLGDYIPVYYKQAGEVGELSQVSHDKIDAATFQVPAGYKKMDMPF